MRRTRMVSVAAISVLALALSACGSSEEESPPPAMTPTPSASPVAASPTPEVPAGPAMPAAAREHTEAGAEAFVEYFWEVVNYAQATGDTKLLRSISANGCVTCDAGIAGIIRIDNDGGRIVSPGITASPTSTRLLQAGDQTFAETIVKVRDPRYTIEFRSSRETEVVSQSTYRQEFLLVSIDGGWLVSQIEIQES